MREGIRQAGMCTFPFAAARERKKLAKRVSYRLLIGNFVSISQKTFHKQIKEQKKWKMDKYCI